MAAKPQQACAGPNCTLKSHHQKRDWNDACLHSGACKPLVQLCQGEGAWCLRLCLVMRSRPRSPEFLSAYLHFATVRLQSLRQAGLVLGFSSFWKGFVLDTSRMSHVKLLQGRMLAQEVMFESMRARGATRPDLLRFWVKPSCAAKGMFYPPACMVPHHSTKLSKGESVDPASCPWVSVGSAANSALGGSGDRRHFLVLPFLATLVTRGFRGRAVR